MRMPVWLFALMMALVFAFAVERAAEGYWQTALVIGLAGACVLGSVIRRESRRP